MSESKVRLARAARPGESGHGAGLHREAQVVHRAYRPGMAAFYTQDARLLAENTELIRGRAAIEQF